MPERVGPDPLREVFGERLYVAAAELAASGSVTDVRVLQGGGVVTGVVGKHRVYIRRAGVGGGDWKIEGECNCSERSPCVHVAAALIVADSGGAAPGVAGRSAGVGAGSSSGAGVSNSAGVGIGPGAGNIAGVGADPDVGAATFAQRPAATRGAASQQQRLLYLLDAAASGLRISVWVGQSGPRGATRYGAGPNTAHPFSLRSSLGGTDFPRYVDASDKEILKALSATRAGTSGNLGGPWDITGESATVVARQIIATGRAFWQSLQGQPLRAGMARHATFTWNALPNGDQQLHCEAGASTAVCLDFEPAMYIDSQSAEAGLLESEHPLSLIRRYWQQTPVTPEDVAATNEIIARDAPFPTLQVFPVQRHPLSTLTARLVLSAGPKATLHFVYNSLQVESERLRDEHATVRQMMDGTLYELPRAHDSRSFFQPPPRTARRGWNSCWTPSPLCKPKAGKSPAPILSPTASPKRTTGTATSSPIAAKAGSTCVWASSWTASTSTCCQPWPATCRHRSPAATRPRWQPTPPPSPNHQRATPAAA
jgi:hypothetical protein